MKRLFATLSVCTFILASLLAAGPAMAQIGPPPATPPDFPTNQLEQVTGLSAVMAGALSFLPAWDRTATNRFNAGELELEVAPTWKSATASGSTPYLSLGGSYYFTKTFGFGADVITLGNGSGSSDLDSAHAFGLLRKDIGNVAGYLMLGGGRDVNLPAWDAEVGAGVAYRYSTGIGLFVDTRYEHLFATKDDHEFLTRVGITLRF